MNHLTSLIFTNSLLAAIYSIIQPDMFESGITIFDELAEHAEELTISKALQVWATPFTGLSVILN